MNRFTTRDSIVYAVFLVFAWAASCYSCYNHGKTIGALEMYRLYNRNAAALPEARAVTVTLP